MCAFTEIINTRSIYTYIHVAKTTDSTCNTNSLSYPIGEERTNGNGNSNDPPIKKERKPGKQTTNQPTYYTYMYILPLSFYYM